MQALAKPSATRLSAFASAFGAAGFRRKKRREPFWKPYPTCRVILIAGRKSFSVSWGLGRQGCPSASSYFSGGGGWSNLWGLADSPRCGETRRTRILMRCHKHALSERDRMWCNGNAPKDYLRYPPKARLVC